MRAVLTQLVGSPQAACSTVMPAENPRWVRSQGVQLRVNTGDPLVRAWASRRIGPTDDVRIATKWWSNSKHAQP